MAYFPLKWLRGLGWVLGTVAYYGNTKRRHITRTNLRLALPELSEQGNIALAKQHLRCMGMALLDRVWLWFAPLPTVSKRLTLTGFEHLPTTPINANANANAATTTQGVILLVPHFVGLEAAGAAWVFECQRRNVPIPQFVGIFQAQKTPWEDALYRHGRGRFADAQQFIRQDGIRPVLKAMRQGRHFYCLPDNDHGEKDAVFVPFFGIPAATLTVLPKLSTLLQAPIVPLIAQMTPQGYSVHVQPVWAIMGKEPLETELAAVNLALETWIKTMPEQYLFSHRRYKTRPVGQASVY